MVGTTTYDHSTNIITTVGGTAVAPITFNDLWLADKAGTLENVHARAITSADANPVAVDHALRPTDLYALGLADVFITVSNFTVNSTVRLVGTEPYGAAQTEDILITANGTYNSTKYWRTITSTQVTVFGGNFTYMLSQGQWGVVWKQSSTQYLFDAKLTIGDGSTATYFTDTRIQITLSVSGSVDLITVTANATTTFGILDDVTDKATSSGCAFHATATSGIQRFKCAVANAIMNVYDCKFTSSGTLISITGSATANTGTIRVYNSILSYRTYVQNINNLADIYNVIIADNAYTGAIEACKGAAISKVYAYKVKYFYNNNGAGINTVSNLVGRNVVTSSIAQYQNDALYLVNPDFDAWTFTWSLTGNVYRQYTFDLKVTDKDGVAISTATVTLKDKFGTVIFSVTTDVNGDIVQQTVSRGYYNQANGNTLQEYSPHTLTIEKAGFQKYTKVFTLSDKIVWQITLFKARPILSNAGKVAVNLSPTDPENMMIMSL